MTNKILIVDDDPNNLDVLRNCLRDAGFKVMVVKDGEKALKRVAHIKPDLILLDVMMPGMDGFETCRSLKKNEATKDYLTKVVVLKSLYKRLKRLLLYKKLNQTRFLTSIISPLKKHKY